MTGRPLAVIAVLVAFATPVGAVPPDDDTARARAADDSARSHYDAHEYAEAIADYRRAYDAMPDPLYLFDIAQAYRKLGDCTNASAYYRNYLRELPTADNREKVERFLADMDACAAAASVHTESVPAAAPVAPSDHTAPVGESSNLRIARTASIIAGAAGLVGIGVGIYFSNEAASRASDLEAACAHGCDARDVAAIDEAGKTAEHRAIVSYVIGGSVTAVGVGLYLWTALRPDAHPVIVTPMPGGASVSTLVRF